MTKRNSNEKWRERFLCRVLYGSEKVSQKFLRISVEKMQDFFLFFALKKSLSGTETVARRVSSCKKVFHNPQATSLKSNNCGPTIPHVDSAAVVRFKGRSIYPLVESCSGYRMKAYFRRLDARRRRWVHPAAQKAAFLLGRSVGISSQNRHVNSWTSPIKL